MAASLFTHDEKDGHRAHAMRAGAIDALQRAESALLERIFATGIPDRKLAERALRSTLIAERPPRVARNDDPHGETKLWSSAGLTQERLGESLATGSSSGKV